MVVIVPQILTAAELTEFREALSGATWVSGRATATGVAAQAKGNLQLADDDPLRARLAQRIVASLIRSPEFKSATLPLRIYPPGFNRYTAGGAYGDHVDTAIRSFPGTVEIVRTDISATLFLSDPDEYDGGELIVQGSSSLHTVKLPAGHLFLYPACTVHSVRPVTRGQRIASFFWMQSMVRDHDQRATLMELDDITQRVLREMPGARAGLQLLALHGNLLRRWADT